MAVATRALSQFRPSALVHSGCCKLEISLRRNEFGNSKMTVRKIMRVTTFAGALLYCAVAVGANSRANTQETRAACEGW